jgi:hypothetical protein
MWLFSARLQTSETVRDKIHEKYRVIQKSRDPELAFSYRRQGDGKLLCVQYLAQLATPDVSQSLVVL